MKPIPADSLETLITKWSAYIQFLKKGAAKDRREGLDHTADVEETSAICFEACVKDLRDLLEESGKKD